MTAHKLGYRANLVVGSAEPAPDQPRGGNDMRRSMAMRYSFWLTAALAWAVFGLTPGARADTPACDDIVQDPTIATCTCICEANSLFAGCLGLT